MYSIRTITASDNKPLAVIIRDTLAEFKANKPGTVFYDERTDRLYEEFQVAGSKYFVLEDGSGKILGGAGIFPTDALPEGVCELVKLYLLPEARGKGLGKKLMDECINAAKESGYKKIYLESMPELVIAVPMYEKSGFTHLPHPMGNSGHVGCGIWMIKELDSPFTINH